MKEKFFPFVKNFNGFFTFNKISVWEVQGYLFALWTLKNCTNNKATHHFAVFVISLV